MPITVKNLLARVAPFRPDLKDEMALFGIREAVRKIAQDSTVMKKDLYGNATINGSRETELTGLDENLNRIENVSYCQLPDGASYQGTWDSAENTPILPTPLLEDTGTNLFSAAAASSVDLYYTVTCCVSPTEIMYTGKPSGSGVTEVTPVYLYNTETNTHKFVADVPGYRFYATNDSPSSRNIPPTPDGGMWIVGGESSGAYRSCESFVVYPDGTIKSGPFIPNDGVSMSSFNPCTYRSRVMRLRNGYMVYYQTYSNTGTPDSTSIRFFTWDSIRDRAGISVNPIPPVKINALKSLACVASNNIILVAPGISNGSDPAKYFRYSPSLDLWASVADPTISRLNDSTAGSGDHVAMLSIGSGKILVVGGNTSDSTVVEIYDTVSNSWSQVMRVWSGATQCNKATLTTIDHSRGLYLLVAYKTNNAVSYILDIINATATPITISPAGDRSDGYTSVSNGVNNYIFGGASPGLTTIPKFSPKLYSNAGHWYSVSTSTSDEIYGSASWNSGDVIYSDGTSWTQYSKYSFTPLPQTNRPTDLNSLSVDGSSGKPASWSQQNSTMFFYPTPDNNYPVNVTVSYSPLYLTHDSEIDIPVDFEQVIVDGALAYLYALPGEGMDKNMAMNYRRIFERGVNNAKCVGIFGFGGSPTYTAPFFAGTGGIR